jgi:hypothetical protein
VAKSDLKSSDGNSQTWKCKSNHINPKLTPQKSHIKRIQFQIRTPPVFSSCVKSGEHPMSDDRFDFWNAGRNIGRHFFDRSPFQGRDASGKGLVSCAKNAERLPLAG